MRNMPTVTGEREILILYNNKYYFWQKKYKIKLTLNKYGTCIYKNIHFYRYLTILRISVNEISLLFLLS